MKIIKTVNSKILAIITLATLVPTAALPMKRTFEEIDNTHTDKIVLPNENNNKKPKFIEINDTESSEEEKEQEKPMYEILAGKIGTQDKESYERTYNEYKKFESQMSDLKENFWASMWGNINYAMTLDEMKKSITDTFNDMKKNRVIISQDDFKKVKHKYYLVENFAHTDLCRIWGVNYLKKVIEATAPTFDRYAVPDYVIVVKDSSKIKVKLSFYHHIWPIVADIEDAKIYFEYIKGDPVGSQSYNIQDIGYMDVGGRNDSNKDRNVLETKDSKRFIVDTEFKSFDILRLKDPLEEDDSKKKNVIYQALLIYAYNRFKYLNGNIDSYEYEFELEKLLGPI